MSLESGRRQGDRGAPPFQVGREEEKEWRLHTMNNQQLDRKVSMLILGKVDNTFKPSQNESDAWRVVDWMYQNQIRVNIKNIHPVNVCKEALAQA